MEKKQLCTVLNSGLLATSFILSGGTALAQPATPQQPQSPAGKVQPQSPQPPPVQLQQPMPQVQPVPPVEKKLAPPAEVEKKKLAPRLDCGPGWKQIGQMSCEAVKPSLQCPPGTNYFEGKFLVGCR